MVDAVPPGFSRHELRGSALVLRDDVADALIAAGVHDPESMRPKATATY